MAAPPTVTIAGTAEAFVNKPTNQGGTITALTQFADAMVQPPFTNLNPALTGASPTPTAGQQLQCSTTLTAPYQTLNQFIAAFAAAYSLTPGATVQYIVNTLQAWREQSYQ